LRSKIDTEAPLSNATNKSIVGAEVPSPSSAVPLYYL